MKYFIEWVLVTTGFSIGALLSSLLLTLTYNPAILVLGASMGYGLHLWKSVEEGKAK